MRYILVAALAACVPLVPLKLAPVPSPGLEATTAALVGLGYVIKTQTPTLVATDWALYEEEKSTGDLRLPVRVIVQATSGGVVLRAECDWANAYWTAPTRNPPRWEECKQSALWPMAQTKERYESLAHALK